MKRGLLIVLSLSAVYLVTSSYSSGPGLNGLNRTGSQGTIAGCGNGCHTSSSNTLVTITVDSAGTSLTHYTPGITYTIKIHGTNSANQPAFGFQFSAAKGVGNAQTQAGTFSGLPTNVHTATVNGMTLVEHGDQLAGSGGTYNVSFQWTAPAAGTGTVSMYAALNAVNNNNSDNGDQFNTTSVTISEMTSGCPLPVITTQPVAQTVCAESPVTFSVATSSTGITYQWKRNGTNINGATSSSYNIPSVTAAQAGNYTVTLTNLCGTTTSNVAALIVNPLPVPVITQAGANLSTAAFSSYQWLKNGTVLTGATSQNYTATSNGSYRVKVTNGNNCSDTSAAVNVTGLSVSELNTGNAIKVYPNPATLILNIDAPIAVNVVIKNLQGQVVKSKQQVNSIDMHDLSAGLYFIIVSDTKGTVLLTNKITKQ